MSHLEVRNFGLLRFLVDILRCPAAENISFHQRLISADEWPVGRRRSRGQSCARCVCWALLASWRLPSFDADSGGCGEGRCQKRKPGRFEQEGGKPRGISFPLRCFICMLLDILMLNFLTQITRINIFPQKMRGLNEDFLRFTFQTH